MNPYQYGFNNPTTFADPAGTMSSYTYGLEKENAALKATNKSLRDIITQQDVAIAEQQDFIDEQQREINDLYTYISSLEAMIREQQAIIARLEAQVRDLQRQVVYWRGEAKRWQRKALYWQGRVMYYAGIVDQLGGRLWGEAYVSLGIAASIHSGHGIPAGAFALDRISSLEAQNATLRADIRTVTEGGLVRQGAWDWIHENRAAGATEMQITGGLALAQFSANQMEANETYRYGQERYEAGYDRGYGAGQDSSRGGWSCASSLLGTV